MTPPPLRGTSPASRQGGTAESIQAGLDGKRSNHRLAEAVEAVVQIGQEAPDGQHDAVDALTRPFLDGGARVLRRAWKQVWTTRHDLDRLGIAAGGLGRASYDVEQRHG